MAGITSIADCASDVARSRQAKKGNKISKAKSSEAAAGVVATAKEVECSTQVGLARLGVDVAARLAELAPTASSSAQAERCLQELQVMMRQLGPEWDARPFGSYANGFGTVVSDLDVTCCQGNVPVGPDAQHKAASVLGEQLIPMLDRHPCFSIRERILGARVPIVKLLFECELEVDISCHNPQPLLNTRLLRAYSRMDPRIKELGVAVKLWAKGAGVCDASKSNLSSYSFTLLVIYFMQVHHEVRLPVLPTDAFGLLAPGVEEESAVATASSWKCELSLPELLALFFMFYANDFGWGCEVASVRLGQRHMASESTFTALRGRQASRLHAEDPIQVERNLNCCLGDVEEAQLRSAFAAAAREVLVGRTPAALQPSTAANAVDAAWCNFARMPTESTSTGSSARSTQTDSAASRTGLLGSDDEGGASSNGEQYSKVSESEPATPTVRRTDSHSDEDTWNSGTESISEGAKTQPPSLAPMLAVQELERMLGARP